MNIIDVMMFTETVYRDVDAFEKLQDVVLDERLDKRLLMMHLLKICGALTPIYTELEAFWFNHKIWFELHKDEITRMTDTVFIKYDPLENYDWTEEEKINVDYDSNIDVGTTESGTNSSKLTRDTQDNGTSKLTTTHSGSDVTTHSGDGSTTTTGGTSGSINRTLDNKRTDDLTTEVKTSAYNEVLYQPESLTTNTGTVDTHEVETTGSTESNNSTVEENRNFKDELKHGEKVIEDGETHDTGHQSDETSGEESRQGSEKRTQDDETETKRHREVLGATGLYTKQRMLKEEREIAEFGIEEWIVNKYKRDNCYLVY